MNGRLAAEDVRQGTRDEGTEERAPCHRGRDAALDVRPGASTLLDILARVIGLRRLVEIAEILLCRDAGRGG